MTDNLLTTEQAANYLGLSVNTLRNIKCRKGYEYLPYVKFGSRVLYKKNDLDQFVEMHKEKTKNSHKFIMSVLVTPKLESDIIALKEGLKEIKSILAKDDA